MCVTANFPSGPTRAIIPGINRAENWEFDWSAAVVVVVAAAAGCVFSGGRGVIGGDDREGGGKVYGAISKLSRDR